MEASELHDSAQSQAIANAGVIARRVIENVARVIHAPEGLLERCVMALLRTTRRTVDQAHGLTLGELPGGPHKEALLRRRTDIGLGIRPDDLVLVDDDGVPVPPEAVPLRLRFAKAVRISVEGNAHFCRGLLATRYGDEPGGLITNTRRTK